MNRPSLHTLVIVFSPVLLIAISVALTSNAVRDASHNLNPLKLLTQERSQKREEFCKSNLQQIYLAIKQYQQDNDSQMPPVVVAGPTSIGWCLNTRTKQGWSGLPVGWADALQPFCRSVALFQCPESQTGVNGGPNARNYTDYWMNGNMSRTRRDALSLPSSTLLLGEGNDGKDISDATYSETALPSLWLKNENSPAQRHLGGANYLMADGTVHWLKPEQVTTFGGRKNAFALK